MNESIEKLGRLIEAQVEEHPGRAALMLSGAYGAVGFQAGRFPSKKRARSREYLQSYTAKLLAGMLRDPSRSAVVNIFMPPEIFCALDIPITAPEVLAAYVVNTACERVFIEKAEGNGVSETCCSYHKVLSGMAESGVLKKPSMIANTTLACDANQLTFRRLAEMWQIPHVLIDVPYNTDEEAVHYVANQLRAMARVAEETSGRKLDPDTLRECIARSRAQIRNYRKYLSLRKKVRFTEALTPEMLNILCNHLFIGSREGLRYSELLVRDAERAPLRGHEKRIIWMHVLPNWQESIKQLFQGADNRNVEIAACDLACSALIPMNPDEPYESMARRLVFDTFNGQGSRRIQGALELARSQKADGVVIFCQWGCKQTQGLALTAKRVLEAEGFPTLVLDGDGCDRANGGSEQIVTRAGAFIEQLMVKE